MRTTNQSLQNTWTRNIQNRLQELDHLNRQIGSGVRVAKPADDPSGASRIVRIEEVVARSQQYLRNIDEALAVHRTTETALEQAYQNLVRAKGLAVEGSNAASAVQEGGFAALAQETAGIREGVRQLANSAYQERYLFAGTSDAGAPFGENGLSYRGDSNQLRVNIGEGQTVPVNLPGDFAFRELDARSLEPLPDPVTLAGDLMFEASDGSAAVTVTLPADRDADGTPDPYTAQELAAEIDAQLTAAGANLEARIESDGTLSIAIADTNRSGEITLDDPTGGLEAVLGISGGTKNVFGVLDDLQAAFESGDAGQVGQMLDRIDRALNALVSQRGLVGARSRNLEYARSRLEAFTLSNETLKAEIEGVDLPEAVMRVSAQEQAYQTALAAGARIFNVSILDFLR